MTGYRYTASEVDAIIERRNAIDKTRKNVIFHIGFIYGFVACMILFGGALVMGWLP